MSAQAPADPAFGLAELQAWLQHAITVVPARALTDADATNVVRPSSRMNALERLDVYRQAYFARLRECLADDYPALCALLGRDRFATLCQHYIAAHAPRCPSLNGYGAGLAAFCMTAGVRALFDASPACDPALLRDLARLEWASVELIHAPDSTPLSGTELLRHAARFAQARFVPAPSVRLLCLEHRVHDLHTSLRAGTAVSTPAPDAAPSYALLYRADWQIHCEGLDVAEGAMLSDLLLAGTCIATAVARAAERGASEHEIGAWFQRWLGGGFIASLEC